MLKISKEDRNLLDRAVREKMIGKEDSDIFLYCWLLLKHGWKKHEEIAETIGISKEDEEIWFYNLKRSGYFTEDGKIELDGLDSMTFILMMLTARGYIERYRKR